MGGVLVSSKIIETRSVIVVVVTVMVLVRVLVIRARLEDRMDRVPA